MRPFPSGPVSRVWEMKGPPGGRKGFAACEQFPRNSTLSFRDFQRSPTPVKFSGLKSWIFSYIYHLCMSTFQRECHDDTGNNWSKTATTTRSAFPHSQPLRGKACGKETAGCGRSPAAADLQLAHAAIRIPHRPGAAASRGDSPSRWWNVPLVPVRPNRGLHAGKDQIRQPGRYSSINSAIEHPNTTDQISV